MEKCVIVLFSYKNKVAYDEFEGQMAKIQKRILILNLRGCLSTLLSVIISIIFWNDCMSLKEKNQIQAS